ncbi:p48 polypeptide of DNA primase [Friedmanniomyces endolithicus]|uniref:DNA primase n=1 Tax=Rachicladosporium monterosium TaxID=1507873 RepID=A0ABR0LE22_9PEZI|nr:p48 polypeptide of DNA primase [Friedmanniomyces endolithicus]KAK1093982.1 p48 polypeptide of DNA primase [Friedmanniomyces endolithicus]KAK1821514.1 p48 polypeptide of DNA primase [Friedmanniomyces endolithicus]KAK5147449.1 p48 polypeptide of DNA primase [Rachicladosporium monterosium]
MPHATSPSPEQDAPANVEDSYMTDAPPAPAEDAESTGDTTNSQQLPTNGAPSTLESMFDDDDDDGDEFSSSGPTKADESSQDKPQQQQQPSKPKYSSPDILRQFYQRLFPFRWLFQWLNHSATPQPDFQNREFAFVLPGGAYIRYQSFMTADLFRKQCVQMTPERFEVGPQYSVNPRDRKQLRKASAFKPIMKELVFDIDMTDYDPIRTCCSGAAICNKCWQFIVMAVKVVDAALREDFGFQHILWVYSGRRGAHAWISDKRAREMDDTKRRALANYLVLTMGNEQGKRTGIKRPLHPHLDRSLKILNPYFQDTVLADQDPWHSPERAEKLLQLLPDKGLTTALQKKWDSTPDRSSNQKWADIDTVAEAGSLTTLSAKQLVDAKQDIRLEYTYPRLDAEVSKKLNHLLKSPFVIHPGTGRVCVPIDTRTLEDFDPLTVPTVTDLLREIDEWDANHGTMSDEERAKVQDWQKTSLKGYVEYFRGYVAGLLKEEAKGSKRGREEDVQAGAESMEF